MPHYDSSISFNEMVVLSQHIAYSRYFKDALNESQALVKAMAGKELGIPPVTAQRCLHIIKGHVTLSANAMAGLVKASNKYDYRVEALSYEACQLEAFEINHKGEKESLGFSSFDLKDAKDAGLLARKNSDGTANNWAKYPRNMLFARAISNMIKWFMPDLTMMPIYTPDEMGIEVNEEGEINVTPETVVNPEPPPALDKPKRTLSEGARKKLEAEIRAMAKRAKADPVAVRERIKLWCEGCWQTQHFDELDNAQFQKVLNRLPKFEEALIGEQPINKTQLGKLKTALKQYKLIYDNGDLDVDFKHFLDRSLGIETIEQMSKSDYEKLITPEGMKELANRCEMLNGIEEIHA